MKSLRIALLTHSTNPRGGVAHALSLGEALHDLGHAVTVFAPDSTGRGFPRSVRCNTRPFTVNAFNGPLLKLVEQRVDEYVEHFEASIDTFDIYHPHDGISGNALATLVDREVIDGFVRTVHHLDDFKDAALSRLQDRSVLSASQIVCVSELWADQLNRNYGLRADVVSNGVDSERFSPIPTAADNELRQQLNIGAGPVFLSIGGIESRKNSVRILQAFSRFHAEVESARLIIAGGASLLDHDAYRSEFEKVFSDLPTKSQHAVRRIGVVDESKMPALIRLSDALLFPSVKEGFGLVVLEAMACGTPAIVSKIAPFTEYLGEADCAWCDPFDIASIERSMRAALLARDSLRQRGLKVASRFTWRRAAERHEAIYHTFLQEKRHAANAVSGAMA